MQQKYRIFLAAVAVLALTRSSTILDLLFDGAEEDRVHYYVSPPQSLVDDAHRSLRRLDAAVSAQNITVYLTGGDNPAHSVFQTDVLRRYGTGRFEYVVRPQSPCDKSCQYDTHQRLGSTATAAGDDDGELFEHYAPCLAVAMESKWSSCHHAQLKCTYPRCKTVVTNDERCEVSKYDIREYYTSRMPNKGYLPLGPRLDSWLSYQRIASSDPNPNFEPMPPSKRKYAFNAIFSQSTDRGRAQLARIINNQRSSHGNLTIFTTMAKQWVADVNSARSKQLDTDHYVTVLLDSVFTLSPAGHNPECFRIFEAIEAGSIPVFVRTDLHRTTHKCKDALKDWEDAPVLILNSWYELYPTVGRLVQDAEKLDEMQARLRLWYDEYMRGVIRNFEDFIVESYKEDETAKHTLMDS